uniref:Uncharacterized protein n=1 Tax=Leptospirillum ferrodiazotrophum TaxID=412449 RepID=C6HY35_9BACT|nr:MAG: hypothetical protein UBAL3_94170086 [Leptospirillum ferrodiazotrophum]
MRAESALEPFKGGRGEEFHPPSGDNQGVRKENPVRKIGISSLHPSWEGRTQIQFRFLGDIRFPKIRPSPHAKSKRKKGQERDQGLFP